MIELVIQYFSGFWGGVELLGTIASLICVYLAAKHSQWTWFFGAIGVLLFGALFYEFKLYSDAGLQILFFLPMQVWGYFQWKKMAIESFHDNVTLSLSVPVFVKIIVAIFAISAVNGWAMATYTDASFPYVDAWTTWMSVFAQVLMIRKYWQSWILWVVMDAVAIYVYYAKELVVVSGLYAIFLIIAAIGAYKWYNDWKEQAV